MIATSLRAPRSTQQRVVELASGTLVLDVHHAERPLAALCTFAARRNPRRGFLFVSTVLGRYTPVRVADALGAQAALAAKIPADLPGPVLVLALAEAGVGLGAGVHAAYRARTGRDDVVFVHSTRHRVEAPLLVQFDEPHSHAPEHRIYRPRADLAPLVEAARSLVLIDDEVTTGRTFARLLAQLRRRLPALRETLPLVLTDWSGERRLPDGTPVSALLHGSYAFDPNAEAHLAEMPDVAGGDVACALPTARDDGRFGVRRPRPIGDQVEARPGERVLVLGTGEYQGAPLRLARRLAAAGADAWFQATTRAPVRPGGPIDSVLEGRDNYGEGLPNYLYNFARGDWDRVLLCQETAPDSACPRLLRATGAELVA